MYYYLLLSVHASNSMMGNRDLHPFTPECSFWKVERSEKKRDIIYIKIRAF